MTKKPHPADAALIAALANPETSYTASILVNREHVTTPLLKSLAFARQAARLMPGAYESQRRAIVYAITKEGRSYMVPDSIEIPTQAKE